jgi:hypothetical protein
MTFEFDEMPVLAPIAINTKDGSFWKRIKGWFSRREWVLKENFYFRINNIHCVIRAGFVFDGASIPRYLWWLLHPTGILLVPALIHDYGYRHMYLLGFALNKEARSEASAKEKLEVVRYFEFDKRQKWDKLFRDISNIVNGFPAINNLAYAGVVAGGWRGWNQHRKAQNDKRRSEVPK